MYKPPKASTFRFIILSLDLAHVLGPCSSSRSQLTLKSLRSRGTRSIRRRSRVTLVMGRWMIRGRLCSMIRVDGWQSCALRATDSGRGNTGGFVDFNRIALLPVFIFGITVTFHFRRLRGIRSSEGLLTGAHQRVYSRYLRTMFLLSGCAIVRMNQQHHDGRNTQRRYKAFVTRVQFMYVPLIEGHCYSISTLNQRMTNSSSMPFGAYLQ
jgi:hypothetical protein